ncbi:MAG: HipA domain-containing protein [Cyclobacteriaceae bacterium]
MATKNSQRSIYTYANWDGIDEPKLLGMLHSNLARGNEIFSFEYNDEWLEGKFSQNLDPDLQHYSGPQYLPDEKSNFGAFLDSSPDRWGRVLMKRREAVLARMESRKEKTLFETDFLLGVFDGHRMGGIRFKESEDGPFLNNNMEMATPPWTSIRELEQAARIIEDEDQDNEEYIKGLNLLIAPGSSLGGARPKASVVDPKNELWIAKFPSKNDQVDIGAWEMVVQKLGKLAGLNVAEAMSGKFFSKQHTYLTKRFDRKSNGNRIHFASAMTLLGYKDGTDYNDGASYLELAEFIIKNGAQVDEDLEELWRRIVFYISVSNADDHLRNHGFLLTEKGWILSPGYDINPVQNASGLSLNISETDNALEFDLALGVAEYFRVDETKANRIIKKVKETVVQWKDVAEKESISKSERDAMAKAFKF